MITIKDLTTLINHLHQANRIFDIEASIEEQKYGKHSEAIVHDLRSRYAPRSAILHNKAELVHSLEKKLLDECNSALVPLKEDTIYKARELIAESAYPWIGRKEPSITFMDDLMSDETFTPFTHHLEDEKKRLLSSSISILNLPEYAHNEIISYFDRTHNKQKNSIRSNCP